jgi:hypothetical protein
MPVGVGISGKRWRLYIGISLGIFIFVFALGIVPFGTVLVSESEDESEK